MSAYLTALRAEHFIDADEHAALAPTGVQSPEELYALTLHFPALLAQALPQGHLARISALAAQRTSLAFRNAAVARLNAPLPRLRTDQLGLRRFVPVGDVLAGLAR